MAGSDDRGQAYTLESLIAALLLVTAVLFALQSVVITPTSAGLQDRDVQAQQGQIASDLLVTAANDGELSRLVRFWDCSDGGFSTDDDAGVWAEDGGYQTDTVPVQDFGETLNHTFDAGTRYNVELVYANDSGGQDVSQIVYQGTPGDDVVTASYTVVLTDGQRVTGRDAGTQTLTSGCSDPAIPELTGGSGNVYNVVEVRVVLW
jgi:hypothetical protein